MNNIIFLTESQCQGSEQLSIFEKRGARAAITDFAMVLGGDYSKYYVKGESKLYKKTGMYWTKEATGKGSARYVEEDGYTGTIDIHSREVGARPVIPIVSKYSIPSNDGSVKQTVDGILEVEYGYYPQRAVPADIQRKLDEEFENKHYKLTLNKYISDSTDLSENEYKFVPKIYSEYEINGKRYIRMNIEVGMELSNNILYNSFDRVWIEVLPIEWLVDEKANLMVSKRILFAGLKFDYDSFNTRFEKTNIKKFIDTYFAKDILQGVKTVEIDNTSKMNQNAYNFNYNKMSEEDIIKSAIYSNVAIFLHGKPGSGKSERVKNLDPNFIELNLVHLDPELLDGISGEKNGKAVHIKPPWLEELEKKCEDEADKIHILFLEEMTNASPLMQAKAYGIALDKKVAGRWKLPKNARVIAAGNEIEDSLVANEMAEPLFDRFAHVNIKTGLNDWLKWAVMPDNLEDKLEYKEEKIPAKIHPAIYAYICYKGDAVLRTPYNREKPEPHADPRRWKMASDMLYASNNPNVLKAVVGEELTADFIYFSKLPVLTIEDVLNKNYSIEELQGMDLGRKIATIIGMTSVEFENMPKIRAFVKQLGPELCKKFEAQWVNGNEERLEQLQEIILEENEDDRSI